jgi:AmmeMemoRadiSam system protein B
LDASANGVRPPAVAGFFYPAEKHALLETIQATFTSPLGPGILPAVSESRASSSSAGVSRDVAAVECFVVPHAGYQYSGPVAAHSYLELDRRVFRHADRVTVIILGPNHNGIGSGVAGSGKSLWRTPLGDVLVDKDLTRALARAHNSLVDVDDVAHSHEHSIEVQLPFLQFLAGDRAELSIVPVCMMLQDKETAEQVADSIVRVLKSQEGRVFVVLGSSDLTHYEEQKIASRKDSRLLEVISRLDIAEFYSVLHRDSVTACGYGPIAVAMHVALALGKKKGTVLKYATSGDVTGEKSRVVGYPAVHLA